ncbi:MAG TPA: hypothetical protein VIJ14_07040, partial [Rhabdochlamydiaceae bacterium]
SAPHEIRTGLVGTNKSIEGLLSWLESTASGVGAKESRQPNLFVAFPGFGEDSSFHSRLITAPEFEKKISTKEIESLSRIAERNELVSKSVDLFYAEIETLVQNNSNLSLIICAPPIEMLRLLFPEKTGRAKGENDFHHLLKARIMHLRIPIQIVRPSTYDVGKAGSERFDRRNVQDPATRAWNFHVALYYKAGGTPWRMKRDSSELTACYVGISFYKSLDGTRLQTSLAQIFNERGDGIIVRGGIAKLSKDDRSPHLEREDADILLGNALREYKAVHKTLPARIVVHKSSSFDDDELMGFDMALQNNSIGSADFIHITDSSAKLYREGKYPVLRGTSLETSNESSVLYTRGSVPYYSTYPGRYVPVPLELNFEVTEQTPAFLSREILALTKMNWNNTQFDGSEPITLAAARRVGKILKYLPSDIPPEPRYSFYM